MSIRAPRGYKFSPVSTNKVPPPAPLHHMSSGHCQCIRCFGRANSDTCHKQPSCEDIPQDLLYSLETEDKIEGEDEGSKERSSCPVTEFTLLRLSLTGERPTAELNQGAHLETQLVQMSGPQSEQMDLSIEDTATEDMEVDEGNVPSSHPGSSELQQTLPLGSALTRSSSSDSLPRIHRGQPGLVCQRAREIESRVRLAGLTMSSQLKRSNSLAKLGDLAISTEDLMLSTPFSVDYDDQEPALCVQSSCSPKLSLTPTVLQSLKSWLQDVRTAFSVNGTDPVLQPSRTTMEADAARHLMRTIRPGLDVFPAALYITALHSSCVCLCINEDVY